MYKRASIETLETFYMKHGTRYDVRSCDGMTIKIDSHGYIYSNFYEYGASFCGLWPKRNSAMNKFVPLPLSYLQAFFFLSFFFLFVPFCLLIR